MIFILNLQYTFIIFGKIIEKYLYFHCITAFFLTKIFYQYFETLFYFLADLFDRIY